MQRRKFVIGAGALASGSAAAVGTGALSTAETGARTIEVDVVGDADSYLGIYPQGEGVGDDPADPEGNGRFANYDDDGKLEIDIGEVALGILGDGEGVNPDSTYRFDKVFAVVNQAHEPNTADDTISVLISENTANGVSFYWEGDQGSTEFGDDAELVESDMTPGTFDRVGIEVDASGLGEDDSISGVIEISAENTSDEHNSET